MQNSDIRVLSGASRRFRGNDHRTDAGAAMVELALVFVLLVMLLVGTVSAAVAYGRGNSIQNAAREASRFGATYPPPADNPDAVDLDDWLGDVRDVARAAASGDLDASTPGSFICISILGATDRRIVDDEGSVAFSNSECYTEFTGSPDGRPAGEQRVQVVVRRTSDLQAVLFSTDITLSADAAARYER